MAPPFYLIPFTLYLAGGCSARKRLKEPSSASQDLYRDFNRDLYINLNFTLFLKVFLMGPRGPQGVLKMPRGPRGLKKMDGGKF